MTIVTSRGNWTAWRRTSTFLDADQAVEGDLDATYRSKYPHYSARTIDRITSAQAKRTTIRLTPQTADKPHACASAAQRWLVHSAVRCEQQADGRDTGGEQQAAAQPRQETAGLGVKRRQPPFADVHKGTTNGNPTTGTLTPTTPP
jgi:hypothetical protein